MSTRPVALKVYDQPYQFEPLLPQSRMEEFALRTRSVVEAAQRLRGATHPATRARICELVRAMNSYYSNRIEGQSTHPLHIAAALKKDFSDQPDIAQKQRIAVAHIEAEQELEQSTPSEDITLTGAFLQQAHKSLYSRLALADRTTDAGRVIEPGALRTEDVTVGRHQPPTWSSLPAFLARADQAYGKRLSLDNFLVTVAAAHHRLAWTHPFLDGNGRACRLQTHCALLPLSGGLWSVNRGMARQRDAYYAKLSEADMARHGDLDGRGNLSEKMLGEWCSFFIELCADQVAFMEKMLDLNQMKERIAGLVLVRSQSAAFAEYRSEVVLPLTHVLAAGPVARGDFIRMSGLGERTGRKTLSQLLKDGLLVTDSPRGEVGIGFPLDTLNILFPNLYPEASMALVDG